MAATIPTLLHPVKCRKGPIKLILSGEQCDLVSRDKMEMINGIKKEEWRLNGLVDSMKRRLAIRKKKNVFCLNV